MNSSVIISIGVFTFFLRSFFNHLPPDEDFGFYFYYPFFRNKGVKLLSDFWSDFPFTLSYIYCLIAKFSSPTILSVRRFTSFFGLILLFSINFVVSHFMRDQAVGLYSALIFGFYLSEPHLGTYFANNENFMILPTMLGVACIEIFLFSGHSVVFIVLAGLFFGLGSLFKPVTVVHLSFFGVYLFVKGISLSKLVCFFTIFFIPILIYALVEHIRFGKDAKRFWNQVRLRYQFTLTYRKGFKVSAQRLIENFLPIFKNSLFIWLFPPIILFMFHSYFSIWLVWLGAEFAVLVIQGVFWDYHFIPFIPVLSAISASFFVFYDKMPPFMSTFCIVLIFHDVLKRQRFLFRTSRREQILAFKKRDQLLYAPLIGKLVKEKSKPSDRILIWGPLVEVYLLSERKALDSFMFYIDPPYTYSQVVYLKELVAKIEKNPPVFFLLSRPDFNIKYLEKLAGVRYCFFKRFGNNINLYKFCGRVGEPCKNISTSDIYKLTKDPGLFYNAASAALEKMHNSTSEEDAWKNIVLLLQYKPLDVGALFLLGVWLKKKGKLEGAALVFEKFLKLKPDRRAHIELGRLYLKNEGKENILKAAKHFSAGIPENGFENYDTLCDAGEAWNKLGSFDDGEKFLKRASEHSLGRMKCYYLLAKSWVSRDSSKALYWFIKGLNQGIILSGEEMYRVSMLYHSSYILMGRGEVSKAISLLKECISLSPQHKKAKELLFEASGTN